MMDEFETARILSLHERQRAFFRAYVLRAAIWSFVAGLTLGYFIAWISR